MPTSTLVNDVKVISSTVGIGPLTLGAAVTAYRGVEALVDGQTYSYSIHQGENREYGRGVFTAATNGFTRGVINSSASNTPIALQNGAVVAIVLLVEDLDERVGIPANLTIGGVDVGTPAVHISGTSPNFILDFTLPPGTEGDPGPGNTLAIGTVTKLAPGSNPTAVITGSSPNQVLNLGLVTGDTGSGDRLKAPVKYALTYPVPTGGRTGLPVADGAQTVAGDDVLDMISADAANRGIYVVQGAGLPWVRRSDFDTAAKVNGAVVFVQDGYTRWAKEWRVDSAITTLGAEPIEFVSWEGGGDTANNLRSKSGIIVDLGDSNTGSYNGTQFAWDRERGNPATGPLAHWDRYMMAVDGMKLNTIVLSIGTGDRNAPPIHYPVASNPKFDGNVWRVVNAKPDWLNIRLLTNDLGLYPRSFAGGGTREAVRANLRAIVAFFRTVLPACHIEFDLPQPFCGEDFIVSGTNVTQFALADPANPTVIGGAAYLNNIMREEVIAWESRHPNVTVLDSQVLSSSPTFRCDNKLTDWLDIETDSVGVHQQMINNGLHALDICERRREQEKWRRHCVTTRDFLADVQRSPVGEADESREEHFMYFTATILSGSDTFITMRVSPEYLFWLSPRDFVFTGDGRVPSFQALKDAEYARFVKGRGAYQRIMAMKGDITLRFEATGNVYHANSVIQSQIVTDPNGELQYIVRFTGINASSEYVSAGNGLTPWLQRVRISADKSSSLPFIQRDVRAVMPLGASAAICTTAFGNPNPTGWPVRRALANRFVATDGALTIDIALANQQADNRLVEYAATTNGSITGTALTVASGVNIIVGLTVAGAGVTAGTKIVSGSGTSWQVDISQTVATTSLNIGGINNASPLSIGTLSFTASNLFATYTPNQVNIDLVVSQNIAWTAPVGSAPGYAMFKSGYRLIATPSIALTRPITLVVSD